MKIATVVFAALVSSTALAQTCQRAGTMTYCDNGTTAQSAGNSTTYSYPKPQPGMPSSSQQVGNTRYYDNGVTRQDAGNTSYYSNGVTRQSVGNTDYYSNGQTCQHAGTMTYCN